MDWVAVTKDGARNNLAIGQDAPLVKPVELVAAKRPHGLLADKQGGLRPAASMTHRAENWPLASGAL